MSLHDLITARNIIFNNETKRLLELYSSKLNALTNIIVNDNVEVKWNFIEVTGVDDLITISGMIKTKVGETIYDTNTNSTVLITEENKEIYAKYIKLYLKASRLETAQPHELYDDIKELVDLRHTPDDMMSEKSFQSLDAPKTRH